MTRIIHVAADFAATRTASRIAFFAALLLLSGALILMLPRSTDAAPEAVCFDRSSLIEHLSGRFAETPVAAGLAANGSMVEVFSSPDGQTWTIVLTRPDGATCVVASGESWIDVIPRAKDRVS